jgi:hypothetical protein
VPSANWSGMARPLAALTAVLALLALLPGTALAQGASADLLGEAALPDAPALPAGVARGGASAAALELPRGPVAEGFELVGHSDLGARGMNAAIAVHDGYVYVGSRTDGQPHHLTPGILVVDVRDPADPTVVGEITEGLAGDVGHTSRELRVWPQRDLLVVLNFGCSSAIHACAGSEVRSTSSFDLFDISGDRAAAPVRVASYTPPVTPHEFFLWVDPAAPAARALLFWTAPTTSQTRPSLYVTDISREGFPTAAWVADFPVRPVNGEAEDRRLHSIAVSNDGRTTHLAFLGAGYLALDTSEVVDGVPEPAISLLTPPEDRESWSNPGAHTSAPIYDTGYTLVTDEVYGDLIDPIGGNDHGCPWGWVRILDTSDLARPQVVSEYRLPENDPAFCQDLATASPAETLATSYSAHNPTLTRDLAFVTWHSAGLQAIDLADPRNPVSAGQFKPTPLPAVVTEDPALSAGLDKVVMWSYPVISDGLIYVIDVRNGLYVLRYTGPRAEEVAAIDFLESNSNLGDALRLQPVVPAAAGPAADGRSAVALAGLVALVALSAGRRRSRADAA